MKKLVSLLLALVMVLSLAACGAKEPAAEAPNAEAPKAEAPVAEATGEKITVILPRHEMDTIGFYEEMTREFEAQTGITVELIFFTSSFGGKLIDDEGHPVMGKDPKTKAAYEFLVKGLESGFIDPSSLTSSQETTNDVFCMGEISVEEGLAVMQEKCEALEAEYAK